MNPTPQQKAAALIEALPWLENFADKVVVIKFSGNAMVNKDLERAFAEDIRFFRYAGLNPSSCTEAAPRSTTCSPASTSTASSAAACASPPRRRWTSCG